MFEAGLQDEFNGAPYAVVAGVDGRTHHLQFAHLDVTGDASHGDPLWSNVSASTSPAQ